MLAPAYAVSAHDHWQPELAQWPAYQLSALDHSQVIADQTFESSMFSLSCLSETLYLEQPLLRLSSAASERPQNESCAEHSATRRSQFPGTAASDPGRALRRPRL